MQQVKLFKGVENQANELEEAINAWIRETGAHVIHITGNIAPQTHRGEGGAGGGLGGGSFAASDLFIFVLYEVD